MKVHRKLSLGEISLFVDDDRIEPSGTSAVSGAFALYRRERALRRACRKSLDRLDPRQGHRMTNKDMVPRPGPGPAPRGRSAPKSPKRSDADGPGKSRATPD